ncbi:hypothetical protein H6G64_36355 [Calothrix sp. FACHB-156]|nr:hypothetical protein [Calothrix sp. FACHB-156]
MKFRIASQLISVCLIIPTFTAITSQTVSAQVPLTCVQNRRGFNIVTSDGTRIISIRDSSGLKQSCEFIVSRLNSAIAGSSEKDLSELLLATGTIGRRRVICTVPNDEVMCNKNNFVIDVPSGEEPNKFLVDILNINAETYTLGDSNQHTKRRTFVKFGQEIRRLPSSKR